LKRKLNTTTTVSDNSSGCSNKEADGRRPDRLPFEILLSEEKGTPTLVKISER